jgi:hypothetical protein
MRVFRPFITCLLTLAPLCVAQDAEKKSPATEAAPAEKEGEDPEVPRDLLEDEHLREEYGVNSFTTPSIRKIFGQLDQLGTLPYDKLVRELPKEIPQDRTQVALSLGVLIGDGFLAVQSEKVSDLESVGRSVLKHAKVLSAGARVTEHARSLLDNSALGDWKGLRDELASTQKDVESEMVLLRDMEIAHLIAIGGWIRGMEIASAAALDPFTPDRAAVLSRLDLAEYFAVTLADLDPKYGKLPLITSLRDGLERVRALVDMPEGKVFAKDQVEKIHAEAKALVALLGNVAAK